MKTLQTCENIFSFLSTHHTHSTRTHSVIFACVLCESESEEIQGSRGKRQDQLWFSHESQIAIVMASVFVVPLRRIKNVSTSNIQIYRFQLKVSVQSSRELHASVMHRSTAFVVLAHESRVSFRPSMGSRRQTATTEDLCTDKLQDRQKEQHDHNTALISPVTETTTDLNSRVERARADKSADQRDCTQRKRQELDDTRQGPTFYVLPSHKRRQQHDDPRERQVLSRAVPQRN